MAIEDEARQGGRKWLPLNSVIKNITGERLRTGDLVYEALTDNSFTIRSRPKSIARNGKIYHVASRRSRTWAG